MAWTPVLIPDQTGRVAVVTGASSGIGAEAAKVLAAKGAHVVLAVRNEAKGEATKAAIQSQHPRANVSVMVADMADLASVRAFAERAAGRLQQIDILINNAGLGGQPKRVETVDGFERQFGTNHLGHFALTGLLMPTLLRASAPRVVAISSVMHQFARMNFADLQGARTYSGTRAYNQSKLANLLFALELDRRARAAGLPLASVAAHPGVSSTGFVEATQMAKPALLVAHALVRLFGQDAVRGAWPGLYAATMPNVQGGSYWGPDGIRELRGDPAPARIFAQAKKAAVAARLWAESERLTGVRYDALDRAAAA